MCKLSVIMPVYNKAKYVEKAIESILRQTLQEWELIIIDDGSVDESYIKCTRFSDERIRLIHTQNGGVSKARNIGLAIAKGEFITFLDADDYVGDTYLEKLYYPNEELVIGNVMKVNQNGEIIKDIEPTLKGNYSIDEIVKIFYPEQMQTGIYGYVASKAVKRSVIEENSICFDENIRLAEDYEFFLKVYNQIESIFFTDGIEYFYVQETENSGIALDDSKIDFWAQMDIQNKTKVFLEKRNSFDTDNKSLYLKRMTGYVYTILLLNHSITYADYLILFNRLKKIVPEVSMDIAGVGKCYIWLYKEGYRKLLYGVMRLRKMVKRDV